eukprot:7308163-Prymnesium_polylepis.1
MVLLPRRPAETGSERGRGAFSQEYLRVHAEPGCGGSSTNEHAAHGIHLVAHAGHPVGDFLSGQGRDVPTARLTVLAPRDDCAQPAGAIDETKEATDAVPREMLANLQRHHPVVLPKIELHVTEVPLPRECPRRTCCGELLHVVCAIKPHPPGTQRQ